MNNVDVTVEISTKDRYDTLQHCLYSVINQTVKPKEVLIFDDGLCKDLSKNTIYANLFKIAERSGVKISHLKGAKNGQVANHQSALEMAEYPLIWRIDDDNMAEANVLEELYKLINQEKVGAAASCVMHPSLFFPELEVTSPKIADCLFYYSSQFAQFDKILEVEHLYSTFLFRKEACAGYPSYLSKVGHREETIMSYEMFLNGWKLLVNGRVITWHLKHPVGGIRTFQDGCLWKRDNLAFLDKLREWGVNLNHYELIMLNNGIGDHFVFKNFLHDIINTRQNKNIIIAACYPDVFFDIVSDKIKIISLHAGRVLSANDSKMMDAYEYGAKNCRGKHIKDIFKEFYLS